MSEKNYDTSPPLPRSHPQKGDSLWMDPIRSIQDIMAIREMLHRQHAYRDELLFVMGINNSLQATTLLKLKVGDVRDLSPGMHTFIGKRGEKPSDMLIMNQVIFDALGTYLAFRSSKTKVKANEFLFPSRKGGGKPLSLPSANALIKQWAKAVGLKGNYGATSLRKTWGYHQRERFGVSFPILCRRFGHESAAITRKYLGFPVMSHDISLVRNEIGVLRGSS